MKKVLFVLVLMMAVLVVNAQVKATTPVVNAQATRTTVQVADLQKAITDNVAKDYVGFTIKEATQVTANNVVTFEVVIVKGTTTETLCYDKDGKFLNKMAAKAGTVEKKVVKPVAKPAPKKK